MGKLSHLGFVGFQGLQLVLEGGGNVKEHGWGESLGVSPFRGGGNLEGEDLFYPAPGLGPGCRDNRLEGTAVIDVEVFTEVSQDEGGFEFKDKWFDEFHDIQELSTVEPVIGEIGEMNFFDPDDGIGLPGRFLQLVELVFQFPGIILISP